MQHQLSPTNIFKRYNAAVFIVFLSITLLSLGISFVRYQYNLEEYLASDLVNLDEQAAIINQSLVKSQQTLKGMKTFAQYYLNNPDELSTRPPQLIQDGDEYYLDVAPRDAINQGKRLFANMTGKGNINDFSDTKWHELTMVSGLTSAFVAAGNTNEDATWFYYLSHNRFVSIYPWISRNSWKYSDSLIEGDNVNAVKSTSEQNDDFIWSPPFVDTAGKGLKVSLGAGVFSNKVFYGGIFFDIDLASLQKRLPKKVQPGHGFALINQQGQVLVHKEHTSHRLSASTKWEEIAPEKLAALSALQLLTFEENYVYKGWLIQHQTLQANGWILIKYQPYSDFTAPVFNRFLFFFMLLFAGMTALLAVFYVMTQKTFIKPAGEFIRHIEHCSEGDAGKVKPAKDWLPWFKIVEDIFGQNRSLLQQLTEQNTMLDQRVTEKTQALIEKSEQHHRDYVLLRSVINAIPEFIIINDTEGNLIGCNTAFVHFIDKQEKELLGQKVNELLPEQISQALCYLSQVFDDPENTTYQQRVETTKATYDVFFIPFFNDQGRNLGSINMLRDVTEQYNIQTALENAKNQAVYANKAKSQFLANMSHEIRTPINAIQGMIELMTSSTLDAFQQRYLFNAKTASTSLLHLIDELLDLSRIEAGKLQLIKENFHVDSLVDKALQLNLLHAQSKKIPILVDIEHDVPHMILSDEMRLVQVLSNLINNAIKFTHIGTIQISIRNLAKSDTNALLRFQVKDTGIGIAKEKQGKLFDAFSQADDSMTREYGGSGLGLSICQKIVNLLGSEIIINSVENQGSEFSFVLPVNLSPENNEQFDNVLPHYSQDLSVIVLAQTMPDILVATIKSLNWQYEFVSDIKGLSVCLANQSSHNKPRVLMVSGDYLTQEVDELTPLIQQFQSNIDLIGVCQSVMVRVSPLLIKQLYSFNIPFELFELPLYRHTLSRLTSALNNRSINDGAQKQTEIREKPISDILKNIHVLLVEDNLVNQMVANELLVALGAKVTIADNGEIALNLLHEINCDLVLMDIQMPVMDGLTAAKKIREMPEYAQLPIIAMTAHARAEDKEASLMAGIDLHISKPVGSALLAKSILSTLALKHKFRGE